MFQFHETWRMENMFKKTLLALTVASATFGAQAGQIFSSTSQPAAADLLAILTDGAAGTAEGAVAGLGGDENCDVAATDVGVTLSGTNGEGGDNDTISFTTNATGIYATAKTVTMTGADACSVVLPTTGTSATSKSPIEQSAAIIVTADIVAGAGGYRQEDTITINFSSPIKTTTIPAMATTAAGGAVFELLDITANTVRFTVKSGSGDVPAFGILNLTNVQLDTSNLSSGTKVSIDTFATNTSGTNYDVIAATEIHELVPQYSAKVTRKFDGIIDVSADRQSLTAQTSPVDALNKDTLIVDVTRDATTNLVTAADTTYTITGDFAWVADAANTSDDGKAVTAAEVTAYFAGKTLINGGDATSVVLAEDSDKLYVKLNGANPETADATIVLQVPGQADGNPVLNEQDFTVAVAVTDGAAAPNTVTMNALSATDAGSWTLNGSVVTIPYMPFDDNTAVIMRHTNTGVQSGDMSVRYMLEGVSTKWESAGVIGTSSRGVQNIRDLVINKIKEVSGATSGKVAIEITTNVPSDDVTVYAGFKVKDEQDRGFVGTFGKHGSAQ